MIFYVTERFSETTRESKIKKSRKKKKKKKKKGAGRTKSKNTKTKCPDNETRCGYPRSLLWALVGGGISIATFPRKDVSCAA